MSVSAYALRDWDAPVPLVVTIFFAPAFVVSGFLVARRHGGAQGVAAAAGAAATGYLVVSITAAGYALVNQSGLAALAWTLFGVTYLVAALMYGVVCGCVGAALARSLWYLGGR
jgi:hypothetical protein